MQRTKIYQVLKASLMMVKIDDWTWTVSNFNEDTLWNESEVTA